ncbi:MAG: immunoglobulin domain-containing protein [Planctomycetota bacterium]|nr:immunoglobulin domain-containing protein [Planctomycetota bacterium]
MRSRVVEAFAALVVVLTVCLTGGAARAQCVDWAAIGTPQNGINGRVNAVVVFDDGNGPDVYIGGQFSGVGAVPAFNIVRWDGATFSTLGTGVDSEVFALAVYDDGTGPALYAGGRFNIAGGQPANKLAKWNGTAWSAVGTGFSGAEVRALQPFAGALYIGGQFNISLPGASALNLAAWTPGGWVRPGGQYNLSGGRVNALTLHPVNGVTSLFIGGQSLFANGPGPSIAGAVIRYDGFQYASVGAEVSSGEVFSLASGMLGGQPALFAGGNLFVIGGQQVQNLAVWTNTQWGAPIGGTSGRVWSLAWSNGRLIAGGEFQWAGSSQNQNTQAVAQYDAALGWLPISSRTPPLFIGARVLVVAHLTDALGPGLFIGGEFNRCAGVDARNIVRSTPGVGPMISGLSQGVASVSPGGSFTRTAFVSGTPPVSLRWHRNGQPVFDSARISGATTPSLQVTDAQPGDTGVYTLVASSPCGLTTSAATGIFVPEPSECNPDFNGDGNVDQDDVAALTQTVAGSPCPQ